MSKNEHTINVLIRKRAKIAGRIENLQVQLMKAVVDLDNVEARLQLFAPNIDVVMITPAQSTARASCLRGTMGRRASASPRHWETKRRTIRGMPGPGQLRM